jgi:hypothetical protein
MWQLSEEQLKALPRNCTKCRKPLVESARMFELDSRDWTYHDRQNIPEEKSHGWFPFCNECG